jgi:hypothetical protein
VPRAGRLRERGSVGSIIAESNREYRRAMASMEYCGVCAKAVPSGWMCEDHPHAKLFGYKRDAVANMKKLGGGKRRRGIAIPIKSKWKRRETREAIQQYQRLLEIQRGMPESEMWKMGGLLREAKMRAYVEIEYERTGITGGGKRRQVSGRDRRLGRLGALVADINRLVK